MRSVKCCLCPVTTSLSYFLSTHSTFKHPNRLLTDEKKNLVILSNSHNIFENLATEEALLRGVVVQPSQQFLFMYMNKPCVVIGRNQNFLQEVSFQKARRDNVFIARRNSGGGAVYHDMGNLCFSFFTHRNSYHPEKTIQLLRLFLSSEYDIKPDRLTTTCRHDLFLDGMKITGSAMRVQRDIAYHHCTLLVSSCRQKLGKYLHSEGEYIYFNTSAVGSVRSPVTTLENAGVLPLITDENDKINYMKNIQCKAGNFFLNYANDILLHPTPWDLNSTFFLSHNENSLLKLTNKIAKEKEKNILSLQQNNNILLLDVISAIRENINIIDGEGRKPVTESSKTLNEEVLRLYSPDWLFSMPKFETCITVTLLDIIKWESNNINHNPISSNIVKYFMQGYTRLNITTIVEKRQISLVKLSWVDESTEQLSQEKKKEDVWCSCLLKLLLEGVNVDDETVIDLSEENTVLTGAIQLECHNLLEGLINYISCNYDNINEGETIIRHFLQTLMGLWRTKNNFIS